MFKKRFVTVVMFLGAGFSFAAKPAVFTPNNPSFVSHNQTAIILGNGHSSDIKRVSYGRPFFPSESKYSINNFVKLKAAFNDVRTLIKDIQKFFEMDLNSGETNYKVWANESSPLYRGGIVERDSSTFNNWNQFEEDFKQSNAKERQADQISVAEKYDLLLDNKAFNLSHNLVKEGNDLLKNHPSFPRWYELSYGSTLASIFYPQPENDITVMASNKTPVSFSVSELKMLLAYTAGKNCRDDIITLELTSAGLFHLALLNYMGIYKKTFMLNFQSNREYRNVVPIAFEFDYRNLKTGNETKNLNEALIETANYSQDPYKDKRSDYAKYIVGVSMFMTLADEEKIEIDYDLEINEEGDIIGGQWADTEHPKYVWTPKEKIAPQTSADSLLINERPWDGKQPLPKAVRDLANTAAKKKEVLNYITKSLLNISRR